MAEMAPESSQSDVKDYYSNAGAAVSNINCSFQNKKKT
jgi:hypothetical protein